MTEDQAPYSVVLHRLEVLNGSGHLQLVWDASDAAQVATAREEVARLKAAGYSFFQVDGSPADEVAAGHGELRCVRVEEPPGLSAAPPRLSDAAVDEWYGQAPDEQPSAPRRGRPRGSSTRTVAVRPQAGG